MTYLQAEVDLPRSGTYNMRLDRTDFEEIEKSSCPAYAKVRFYSWQNPAVSFGYSQKIEKLVDVAKAKKLGIELVRRITGGGMVFHQPGELTYCLAAANDLFSPRPLENYKHIACILKKSFKEIGIKAVVAGRTGIARFNENICFSKPTRHELLVGGKKIAGSAQKKGRRALLQHGAIQMNKRLPVFNELLDLSELDRTQISVQEAGCNVDYRCLAEIIKNILLKDLKII